MSQLHAALPVLLATRKARTHVPLVFAVCRISIRIHLKYHIPVSSFARHSLHPSSANSNFSFPQQLEAARQLFISHFSLSRLSRQDTKAKRCEDERSVTLGGVLMKTIGWEPPVQHLTRSGESSGGIHSPTVADGNRLELKVQKKRPRLRAGGGADRAHSAGASVMLGT